MELFDLFLDTCFMVLAIAGMVFVIVRRKHFDTWLSLLTCTAWIFKGIRLLYFDWIYIALNNMKEHEVFLFMNDAHFALQGMDILVNLLLVAALARLAIIGLYSHWYKKAMKSLIKNGSVH